MTWTSFRNRGEILRSVIAVANTRRDGLLPLDGDLDGELSDAVRATFGDELTLLGALQLKWHTRLNGHIERQLLSEPMDLESAVVAAWCGVADELPGVRAILDHYRDHPTDEAMATALERATVKEHAYLATMAGRCSVHDLTAAPLGRAIEDRAHDLYEQIPVLPTVEERPSFLERLRAVLAA